MELVDSLSSNKTATSVVELSLSPLHRRNYCSITRVLDEYMPRDAMEKLQQKKALTKLLSNLYPSEQSRTFHLFAVDCTPAPRIFSPKLEERKKQPLKNVVDQNPTVMFIS